MIDNISYGLDAADFTEDDVTECAKMANAHEFIADLPEDLADRDFAKAAAVKLYLDEHMKYTRIIT